MKKNIGKGQQTDASVKKKPQVNVMTTGESCAASTTTAEFSTPTSVNDDPILEDDQHNEEGKNSEIVLH